MPASSSDVGDEPEVRLVILDPETPHIAKSDNSPALVSAIEILVLDEATSALDAISENHIKAAISSLHGEVTQILIAHRLSTVQHADEIVVLEQGHIRQRGTHNQLINQEGIYKRLVEMQQVR